MQMQEFQDDVCSNNDKNAKLISFSALAGSAPVDGSFIQLTGDQLQLQNRSKQMGQRIVGSLWIAILKIIPNVAIVLAKKTTQQIE